MSTSNPDPEVDPESAEEESLKNEADIRANDDKETAEHVKVLIEDCKKLLVPDLDNVVGAWGLIDNDPVSGTHTFLQIRKYCKSRPLTFVSIAKFVIGGS